MPNPDCLCQLSRLPSYVRASRASGEQARPWRCAQDATDALHRQLEDAQAAAAAAQAAAAEAATAARGAESRRAEAAAAVVVAAREVAGLRGELLGLQARLAARDAQLVVQFSVRTMLRLQMYVHRITAAASSRSKSRQSGLRFSVRSPCLVHQTSTQFLR